MCDFSLQHAKSRPAQVADKLVTHDFGRGTIGFTAPGEFGSKLVTDETPIAVAVCVLPGTEIAFEEQPILRSGWFTTEKTIDSKVARFRQVDKETAMTHHDALEFADGQIIKLTLLVPGQKATVLQLPAAPKTEAEAQEQKRLEVVA